MLRYTYRSLLGVGLLLGALGACKAPAPTAARPSGLPDTFSSTQADTAANMAQLPWRQFFPDTLLQSYIGKALAQNYGLAQSMERVLQAQSQLRQDRLLQLPEVQVGAQGGLQEFGDMNMDGIGNNETVAFLPDPYRSFKLGVGFRWEVDLWGRLRGKKRAAAARWMASVEAARLAQTLLVSEVATHYFALVAADAERKALQDALAGGEQAYALAMDLKQAGMETQLAVSQLYARVLNLRGRLEENAQRCGQLERALCTLMGEYPRALGRIGFEEMSSLQFPFSVGVPAQLLLNRPDIRTAALSLEAANADAQAARAAFFPQLVLGGSAGFNSFDLSKLLNPSAMVYDLAAGLVAPIFQQRQVRTLWEQAKAEERIALSQYAESVLKAYVEVANTMTLHDHTRVRLRLKQHEREVAQQSVLSASDLFRLDEAGYLDVLAAEERALQCALEHIELAAQYCGSQVMLYRALGGGGDRS